MEARIAEHQCRHPLPGRTGEDQRRAAIPPPCTEKRLFSIEDVANTGLRREADSLFDDGAQGLFVDLRGTMGPAKVRGTDGKLEVSRLYRVQNEGPGCDDPNFKLLTFAANGNEPFWSARVNNQGLRLDRPEHETLALPLRRRGTAERQHQLFQRGERQEGRTVDRPVVLHRQHERCLQQLLRRTAHRWRDAARLRLSGRTGQ